MKILGWINFIAYQVAGIVLGLIGFPLVVLLSIARAWEIAPGTLVAWGRTVVWRWRFSPWFYLWSNDEDGIAGGQVPTVLGAIYWSALRNSTNNLRFAWPGGFSIIPAGAVVSIRRLRHGYIVTWGWRQCVTWRGFRFGWRMDDTAAAGYRVWPVVGRA